MNERYDTDLLDKVDFMIQKSRLCSSGRDDRNLGLTQHKLSIPTNLDSHCLTVEQQDLHLRGGWSQRIVPARYHFGDVAGHC